MKSKICVSFSGGQTSAYMAKWIKENHSDKELKFVFANTGQEHPKTYEFIKRVEEYLGIEVTWIEPLIPEDRNLKTGFKIVDSKSYCTDGTLFEDLVKRFGVPNMVSPVCTRELKIYPIKKYLDSVWEKKSYQIALGIRADEIDRVNKDYEKLNYYYPLAWNGVTKQIINDFWDKQPFKLEIPNYLGNCVWCWKKSFSKHRKIINEFPEFYDVPNYLEKKYPINNIPSQKMRFGKPQTFFRNYQSAEDLLNKKKELEQLSLLDEEEGYENSCQESCEVFT